MPAGASLIKAVPNILSGLRLALALAFPAFPLEWRLPATLGGAASDWLDGLIARRYQATSTPGALLDAAADKAFTLSVLLTMTIAGPLLWWQLPIVLCRDLSVALVACIAAALRRPDAFAHMRPRLPGKITTSLVFLWLIAVLAGAPEQAAWAMFALAGGASVLAAGDYLRVFAGRFAEVYSRSPPAPSPPR